MRHPKRHPEILRFVREKVIPALAEVGIERPRINYSRPDPCQIAVVLTYDEFAALRAKRIRPFYSLVSCSTTLLWSVPEKGKIKAWFTYNPDKIVVYFQFVPSG
jgi:hypothetical protein